MTIEEIYKRKKERKVRGQKFLVHREIFFFFFLKNSRNRGIYFFLLFFLYLKYIKSTGTFNAAFVPRRPFFWKA